MQRLSVGLLEIRNGQHLLTHTTRVFLLSVRSKASLHKLTYEDLKAAPSSTAAAQQLFDLLSELHGPVLVLAWNAYYDKQTVQREFHNAKLSWATTWKWGDLIYLAKYLAPECGKGKEEEEGGEAGGGEGAGYSIAALLQFLEIKHTQSHRALDDCRSVLRIIFHLLQRMDTPLSWTLQQKFFFALQVCFAPSLLLPSELPPLEKKKQEQALQTPITSFPGFSSTSQTQMWQLSSSQHSTAQFSSLLPLDSPQLSRSPFSSQKRKVTTNKSTPAKRRIPPDATSSHFSSSPFTSVSHVLKKSVMMKRSVVTKRCVAMKKSVVIKRSLVMRSVMMKRSAVMKRSVMMKRSTVRKRHVAMKKSIVMKKSVVMKRSLAMRSVVMKRGVSLKRDVPKRGVVLKSKIFGSAISYEEHSDGRPKVQVWVLPYHHQKKE